VGGYVFVSYSHSDAAYARKLGVYLSSAAVPVWIDHEIVTGDRWSLEVRQRVEGCAAMVVVMSPAADDSVWVEREIAHAQSHTKSIFPLLLAGRPLFRLGEVEYEDVTGLQMPSARLVARLRELVETGDHTDHRSRSGQGGPVPTSATPCMTVPRWGGPDHVISAAFSHDGQSLAVTNGANTVRLYDTATWGLRRTLHQYRFGQGNVWVLAWSPDGRLLTGGSYPPGLGFVGPPVRRTIQVWDAMAGRKLWLVAHGDGDDLHADRMAVSPNGRRVATCAADNTARVWNIWGPGNRGVLTVRHLDVVQGVAFSPDGQLLITAGGDDKTARAWDLVTGEQRLVLRHQYSVRSASVSPDGTQLLTASTPGIVWDLRTGERLGELDSQMGRLVHDVAHSPDGQWMATAGVDSTARIWNTDRAELLTIRHDGPVRLVTFSPDGRLLLTATTDGAIRVWRLDTASAPLA
jgi:hypothetical protein